jgi:hypothetical protein
MNRKHILQSAITAIVLVGITAALYLYTSGYRLSKPGAKENNTGNQLQVKRTGMIGARSIPEGANVYLNDKLVTATDDTISNLRPGEKYKLTISKNGYFKWEKDVQVFPELVTDITAVLVSKTPRLEPLTNTGAKSPSMAPSLSKLAFFSQDPESPGIWVISLVGGGLDLFKSNANSVLEDTIYNTFSKGKKIEWSPDEKQLLITVPEVLEGTEQDSFYLVDIEAKTAESTESPELLKQSWLKKTVKLRQDIIKNIDVPANIREIALREDSKWSPDNKKFLYKVRKNGNFEYRVYNMEKPIPVGEETETLVFSLEINKPQPEINWYADSYHLVLAEGAINTTKRGKISLVRIDGTNKMEVYNNSLYDAAVFSSPGGDKLIISTSFTSDNQTNLYTLGIR